MTLEKKVSVRVASKFLEFLRCSIKDNHDFVFPLAP
jgi:hypothetical protein